MREKVLAAARIHEGMKPRDDEDALRPRGLRRVVEDGESKRRLASGVDRRVELGFELGMKRLGRAEAPVAHGRHAEGGA
jgi:hypothetical protein